MASTSQGSRRKGLCPHKTQPRPYTPQLRWQQDPEGPGVDTSHLAAGPRDMSTPEPPLVLKSVPILQPACSCSQTEMWTNGNALVSFPTGDTLLTTLLSRRHSATPRVAAGQSLRQPTSHSPPPGPMPSHCPHREPRHGCVAKSGSEKRPLSLIQLWEFLKCVGRFPSFMPTSARHMLFLPPKGSRRLDGCSWNGSQGSPQPRHQGRL